ncbi:MAG: SAM-dependent methyltransferase [Pseudomonadota bacterium]
MHILMMAILGVLLAGCAATGPVREAQTQRPQQDVARDAGRKPFAVLDFLGVASGMTTLDLIASGGYYSEVLAQRVGPQGRVYAQNPAVALRFYSGRNDRALQARLAGARLPNVRRLDREFDDLGLRAGSVHVALTALNFHDVYNTSPAAAAAILQSVKSVLKPGGVLGIIDHVGAVDADNKALHRIDPQLVIDAAQTAGFKVERSDLLANPADDHTQAAFAPSLRGQTDRFVLKLTRP